MISGTLSIDATPSRASYGLLTPSALGEDIRDRAKAKVLDNIAEVAQNGDRMAMIYDRSTSIPELAAQQYGGDPPDVVLVAVARPIIQYIPPTGNNVDINA